MESWSRRKKHRWAFDYFGERRRRFHLIYQKTSTRTYRSWLFCHVNFKIPLHQHHQLVQSLLRRIQWRWRNYQTSQSNRHPAVTIALDPCTRICTWDTLWSTRRPGRKQHYDDPANRYWNGTNCTNGPLVCNQKKQLAILRQSIAMRVFAWSI